MLHSVYVMFYIPFINYRWSIKTNLEFVDQKALEESTLNAMYLSIIILYLC